MTRRRNVARSDTGPFAIIPEWALWAPISDSAFRLYAALCRLADAGDKCFPSRKALAKRLGKSTRQIQALLNQLREAGCVDWERRTREDGGLTSNLYFIRRLPLGTNFAGASEEFFTGGCEARCTPYNENQLEREPINENPPVNTPPQGGLFSQEEVGKAVSEKEGSLLEVAWQRFCQAYPRRFGKDPEAPAKRRFLRLVRDRLATAEELVAAAERYRRYCDHAKMTGTQFVKEKQNFLSPTQELWKEPFELSGEGEFERELRRLEEEEHGRHPYRDKFGAC